jgi:hypothetical protein
MAQRTRRAQVGSYYAPKRARTGKDTHEQGLARFGSAENESDRQGAGANALLAAIIGRAVLDCRAALDAGVIDSRGNLTGQWRANSSGRRRRIACNGLRHDYEVQDAVAFFTRPDKETNTTPAGRCARLLGCRVSDEDAMLAAGLTA